MSCLRSSQAPCSYDLLFFENDGVIWDYSHARLARGAFCAWSLSYMLPLIAQATWVQSLCQFSYFLILCIAGLDASAVTERTRGVSALFDIPLLFGASFQEVRWIDECVDSCGGNILGACCSDYAFSFSKKQCTTCSHSSVWETTEMEGSCWFGTRAGGQSLSQMGKADWWKLSALRLFPYSVGGLVSSNRQKHGCASLQ